MNSFYKRQQYKVVMFFFMKTVDCCRQHIVSIVFLLWYVFFRFFFLILLLSYKRHSSSHHRTKKTMFVWPSMENELNSLFVFFTKKLVYRTNKQPAPQLSVNCTKLNWKIFAGVFKNFKKSFYCYLTKKKNKLINIWFHNIKYKINNFQLILKNNYSKYF